VSKERELNKFFPNVIKLIRKENGKYICRVRNKRGKMEIRKISEEQLERKLRKSEIRNS